MTGGRGVHVRVATGEDADGLLPMFEAFYGDYLRPKTAEAIREHLRAAAALDTVLIAEDDGAAVGFASLRILPQVESDVPHAELSDLFVDETRRRQGAGRALVAFAEALSRRRGCRSLQLTVGFDNGGARAFYRAAGFSDFALTMKKPLEAGP